MQVIRALDRVEVLLPQALAAQANLLEINNMMQEVFIDTGNVNQSINRISTLLRAQAGHAEQIRANVSLLSKHTLLDLSGIPQEEYLEMINRAYGSIDSLINMTRSQQTQTSNIGRQSSNLNPSDVLLQLDTIEETLMDLNMQCNMISSSSTQLSSDVDSFNALTSSFMETLAEIERSYISVAQMLLLCAGGDIQVLDEIIGTPEIMSSGSGDRESSGVTSGLPFMEEGLRLLEESGTESTGSIAEHLSNLQDNLDQLRMYLLLYEDDICDSADLSELAEQAEVINR